MVAQGRTILEIARGETSEGQLFDELSQGIASGAISRRRALKLAGAAILGSTGLLALFPRAAGAQSSIMDKTGPTIARSDRGCRGEPAINNRRCVDNPCGGQIDCLCAETVRGDKKCVELGIERCPRRDQCDRNEDCRRGEVCVKVGGCCGRPRRNLCAGLCD
jgi:hypothetical protein